MSSEMQLDIAQAYVDECRRQLAHRLEKIAHCLNQLNDEQIWWRPHEDANSVGNIIMHLCGNMRQWILHGIGGEPDNRDRPEEFAQRGPIGKDDLLSELRSVIDATSQTLTAATAEELLRRRRIQGFKTNGLAAIFDSVSHLAGHTQEIIYITRLQLGRAYQFHWRPLTAEEGA